MSPLTPKQLQNYMIAKQGKAWNTEIERDFNEYQKARGLGLIQNVTLNLKWEGRPISLQCDFVMPVDWERYAKTGFHDLNLGYIADFETDGMKYHSSMRQMRKDKWKDSIKVAAGIKVIHIPGELTSKKWWPHLDIEIPKALNKPLGAIYIAA